MASAVRLKEKPLEELLVQAGLLPRAEASGTVELAKRQGVDVSRVLADKGVVGEKPIAEAICAHFALPYIDLAQCYIPSDVKRLFPADLQQKYDVVVLDKFSGTIVVATCRTPSQEVLGEIKKRTNCEPQVLITTVTAVRNALSGLAEASAGAEAEGAEAAKRAGQEAVVAEPEEGKEAVDVAASAESGQDRVSKEADNLFAELQKDLERFTPKGASHKGAEE
ncbi:MAG: hypothetical protein V2A58_13940 [Planctomycetota bacterium]